MTNSENRQRLKSEAINKLLKLYHPQSKFDYRLPSDSVYAESLAEEREGIVRHIVEQLQKNLDQIKTPNNEKKV